MFRREGGGEEAKGHISHFSICLATERAAQSLTSFSFQTHGEGGGGENEARKKLPLACSEFPFLFPPSLEQERKGTFGNYTHGRKLESVAVVVVASLENAQV